MRRYIAFAALGIAAIWLAWVGGRMAGPGPVATAEAPFQAPAKRFVGAWFSHLYPAGNPTAGIPIMVTVNLDGTVLFSGGPGTGRMVTTAHGSWKAVRPNTIVGTAMSIGWDLDGNPLFYEKGPLCWTLTDGGDQLEGTLSIGMYLADQDPLGEEDPAWGTIPCDLIGRRIPAE